MEQIEFDEEVRKEFILFKNLNVESQDRIIA